MKIEGNERPESEQNGAQMKGEAGPAPGWQVIRFTKPLLDTLNEAIRNRELAADLPLETVRSAVYGTIEHLMWPVLYSRCTIGLEMTADQLTGLLLSGLAAVGNQARKAESEPTTGG